MSKQSTDGQTPDDGCVETPDVDCSKLFEQLDVLLDRELPQHELDQLEAHLSACLPCAGRRDFEQQLRTVIHDCHCEDQAPPALLEKIRAHLDMELPSA